MKSIECIYMETIELMELSTSLLVVMGFSRRMPMRWVIRLRRLLLRQFNDFRFEAIEKLNLVALFFEGVER